jgi:hypothetical protein
MLQATVAPRPIVHLAAAPVGALIRTLVIAVFIASRHELVRTSIVSALIADCLRGCRAGLAARAAGSCCRSAIPGLAAGAAVRPDIASPAAIALVCEISISGRRVYHNLPKPP